MYLPYGSARHCGWSFADEQVWLSLSKSILVHTKGLEAVKGGGRKMISSIHTVSGSSTKVCSFHRKQQELPVSSGRGGKKAVREELGAYIYFISCISIETRPL